jgi:hypothetical protein
MKPLLVLIIGLSTLGFLGLSSNAPAAGPANQPNPVISRCDQPFMFGSGSWEKVIGDWSGKAVEVALSKIELAPPTDSPRAERAKPEPEAIMLRPHASKLEAWAGNEIRRYAYLRTGRLLPVKQGAGKGPCIRIACQDRDFCGELGQGLQAQQFLLRTLTTKANTTWWIVGG